MHPFRFGVQLSRARSMRQWREAARKVEELGYSTLSMPDHFDDQFGPLVALTVAAEATSTLKIASLVLDNDYRHPAVLARECATLDLASEGRLEVGLGAGWLETDYLQSGISYDSPTTRVSRLEEGVKVMKALWRDDKVDFEGVHYRLREAMGSPRPHTPGGPPLMIGGGSRQVLRVAAEQAQIVGVNLALGEGQVNAATIATAAPEHYDERVAWVRAFAGERFDEIELQGLVFVAQIGRPQAEVAEEMSAVTGLPASDIAETPAGLFGTEEEIVETLERRRERWGYSYWVLHEAEIETFAPVAARLSGT